MQKYIMDEQGFTYELMEDGCYKPDFECAQITREEFWAYAWEINSYMKDNQPEKYKALATEGRLNAYIKEKEYQCMKWESAVFNSLWVQSKGPELKEAGQKQKADKVFRDCIEKAREITFRDWIER